MKIYRVGITGDRRLKHGDKIVIEQSEAFKVTRTRIYFRADHYVRRDRSDWQLSPAEAIRAFFDRHWRMMLEKIDLSNWHADLCRQARKIIDAPGTETDLPTRFVDRP